MAQLVHPGVIHLIFSALDGGASGFVRENQHFLDLAAQHPEGVPASVKTDLLGRLLEFIGADSLLKLADGCREEMLSPLLFVLLNSPNPAALINKFQHHHKYFHSANQVVLCEEGDLFIVVEHVSIEGGSISAADDLFFCGVLRVLLQKIGCHDVTCTWEQAGHPDLLKCLPDLARQGVPVARSSRWRYGWSAFERLHFMPGLDEYFVSKSESLAVPDNLSMTEQVEKVLTEDLERRWLIDEVASRLGISARSMQRKLALESTNFLRVYAETRVGAAARLLRHTQLPLVDIGYMAGFADSAHFSREFKKARGMTPKAYRKKL